MRCLAKSKHSVNFYLKNEETGFLRREATQTRQRNVEGGQGQGHSLKECQKEGTVTRGFLEGL